MLVGCDVVDKVMRVSFYNEEGKLELFELKLPDGEMYNWYETNNPTNYKSWNNKNIMPVLTQSLSRFRIEELFQKYFTEEYQKRIFARNLPKISYLDIENDVPENGEFTEAKKAEYPINTLSIINEDNIIIISTLMYLDNNELKRIESDVNKYFEKFNAHFSIFFRHFVSEGELLNFFANALLPKLGFITGWNVVKYDWTYIYNRCKQLGVNLLGRMPTTTTQGQYNLPTHIGIVDSCEAVIEFNFFENEVENYKLETVSNYLFGLSKLENPYNTMREFMQDKYRFILYNIIDSCLVKYINETLQIYEVITSMCTISQIEVNRIFSNVYIANLLYCREFIKEGKYFPVVNNSNSAKLESYKGSFIKEPKKGFFNTICTFDFRSMYPFIGVEFDISPEAYLGKDETKCVGKEYVKTALGTIFENSQPSMTAKIFTKYLDKRLEYKTQLKEKKHELEKLLQC